MAKHFALFGPTGIGKTYTLYYTLKNKGHKVLLIRSLEELYKIEEEIVTDIIFDDISFELSKPELLIHLCDKDFPGTVRILRRAITIPTNITKWFTHNNRYAWEPVLCSYEQLKAIERRLNIINVNSREEIEWLLKENVQDMIQIPQ